MPRFRLEVHACTDCSHALVAERPVAFAYLNTPPAAGAPILACPHVLAAAIAGAGFSDTAPRSTRPVS